MERKKKIREREQARGRKEIERGSKLERPWNKSFRKKADQDKETEKIRNKKKQIELTLFHGPC